MIAKIKNCINFRWLPNGGQWLILLLGIVFSASTYGHARGEDYVFVNFLKDRMEGDFQVNIHDLKDKFGIDIPQDIQQAKPVIKENQTQIWQYIRENFSISDKSTGKPYELQFSDGSLFEEAPEYVSLPFVIENIEIPDEITIYHDLYYEIDPLHRGLFLVQYNVKTDIDYGPEYTALIFNPNNQTQSLDLNNIPGLIGKAEMFVQGLLHILSDVNHAAFLLAMLLLVPLTKRDQKLEPEPRISKLIFTPLILITAFAVANFLALHVSSQGAVTLKPPYFELILIAGILVVALNNFLFGGVKPLIVISALIGFVHGLGFADILGNLAFRLVDVSRMITQFSLGLAAGQAIFCVLVIPALYLLSKQALYVPMILKAGSVILAAVGLYSLI